MKVNTMNIFIYTMKNEVSQVPELLIAGLLARDRIEFVSVAMRLRFIGLPCGGP